jgi:hypothetical protein
MTEQQFCYWLKGFFELTERADAKLSKQSLNSDQVEMIEKHLRSVFAEKIMQQPFFNYDPRQGGSGPNSPIGGGAIC